jgi:putative tricarboxylic transport membrane protein
MDIWTVFQAAFSPEVLFYTSVGTFIGLIAGALPGVSGGMAMAMLLPVSMFLEPLSALGLIVGAYKGNGFGGSITAIAYGVPGSSDSVVAIYDGYTLTKKGYPKKAMSTALYTSLFADTASNVLLLVVVAPLAMLAIAFGPREIFALTFFAVVLIIVFVHESPIRGAIAAGIGIFVGSIGTDPQVAISSRYTFHLTELLGGIDLVPFVIGLIGMNLLWEQAAGLHRQRYQPNSRRVGSLESAMHQPRQPDDYLTFREWLTCWKELIVGTVLGIIIGAIPGPGATTAAFSSYGILKRFSSDGKNFGKGSMKGLVAAEGPDSANVGATLIPLFAFGIPGSVSAAIFAAALLQQGVAPGPTMLITHTDLLYSFLILLIFANFINFVLSKALIPLGAYFAKSNGVILLPVLLLCNLIGAYAYMNSYVGVVFALLGAVLGCFLRRWNLPSPPVIITMLVVPLMEKSFGRAAIIADGNIFYFFSSPLSLSLYALMIVFLFFALRKPPAKLAEAVAISAPEEPKP